MSLVVVPVRYPLNPRSRRTLEEAVALARERDAALSVLHVNLYQNGSTVTRTDLKQEVERTVGRLNNARYTVRSGFLVEEAILDEVAAEGADVVVIGERQAGRLRRILERFTDNPNIDGYLRRNLDCEVRTVDVS
ncbi:MAG: universal stress protein [Natrialbaceae archaeon]|nr:universal stress protein [Natrialbaceae archaeon]